MKKAFDIVFIASMLYLCTLMQACTRQLGNSTCYHFILPSLPGFIVGGEARISYMGLHFWDNCDFKDASFIRSREGQTMLYNYMDLLSHLPAGEGASDIGDMTKKARADSATCMEVFTGVEKILYDPNSLLRNETLYMEVLDMMFSWGRLDEVTKSRSRFQYRLARKNRPKAVNFSYTLRSGKQCDLYSLHSEYVLLYINNSRCDDCRRVQKRLEESPEIKRLTAENRLTVLSVYPDEDLGEWKKAERKMPGS